jgi:DDE family transposase
VKELNEMTIGRTDDPKNPFCAAAFEVVSLLGSGSRTPSGPADMAPRRKGRTHDRNRHTRQISHFSLASKGPSTQAQRLTDQDVDDPSQVGLLLDQIDDPIVQVTADGAYDGAPTYQTIAQHGDGIEVVIPPRVIAPAPNWIHQHSEIAIWR